MITNTGNKEIIALVILISFLFIGCSEKKLYNYKEAAYEFSPNNLNTFVGMMNFNLEDEKRYYNYFDSLPFLSSDELPYAVAGKYSAALVFYRFEKLRIDIIVFSETENKKDILLTENIDIAFKKIIFDSYSTHIPIGLAHFSETLIGISKGSTLNWETKLKTKNSLETEIDMDILINPTDKAYGQNFTLSNATTIWGDRYAYLPIINLKIISPNEVFFAREDIIIHKRTINNMNQIKEEALDLASTYEKTTTIPAKYNLNNQEYEEIKYTVKIYWND